MGENTLSDVPLYYLSNPLWDGTAMVVLMIMIVIPKQIPHGSVGKTTNITASQLVVRICNDSPHSNEDIGINLVDLCVLQWSGALLNTIH